MHILLLFVLVSVAVLKNVVGEEGVGEEGEQRAAAISNLSFRQVFRPFSRLSTEIFPAVGGVFLTRSSSAWPTQVNRPTSRFIRSLRPQSVLELYPPNNTRSQLDYDLVMRNYGLNIAFQLRKVGIITAQSSKLKRDARGGSK